MWALSGAVSGHSRKRLSGERSVEREAAERRAGVTKISLSAERQIGRSRSAQMLCYWRRVADQLIANDGVEDAYQQYGAVFKPARRQAKKHSHCTCTDRPWERPRRRNDTWSVKWRRSVCRCDWRRRCASRESASCPSTRRRSPAPCTVDTSHTNTRPRITLASLLRQHVRNRTR